MKSYEVMRAAVEEQGVKRVAAELRVSPALVYKWCEQPKDEEDQEQSGTKNPLDRVREVYLLTRDIRVIRWLCNEAGGFFIPNPVADMRKSNEENIFQQTRQMMRDFSALLDAVHESMADDASVDRAEADKIREKWEDLKAAAEAFAVACEKGHYCLKGK